MSSVVGVGRRDAYHFNNLGVYVFCDHIALRRNVIQHFVQCLGFDLLALQFGTGVVKIKNYFTLMEFSYKKI